MSAIKVGDRVRLTDEGAEAEGYAEGRAAGLEEAAALFSRRANLSGTQAWKDEGARISEAIRAL